MTQFAIHRQTKTNRCFFEDLGKDICLEMALISSGTFLMGSPKDELERRDTEGPQHLVTVPTFFMGRYPITQAQWRAVAAMSKVEHDLEPDLSRFKGDMRPVEQVSWEDAMEFCARLSARTKRSYSLPSEAEWEYACRAGTTTPFHFGETITTDVANYRGTDDKDLNRSGSYGDGPKGEYRKETTPVDYFGVANAFGLCDMHGNVWEWCLDSWHGNYEGAPTDGSAWDADRVRDTRVLRGGSWNFNPRYCRSAYRGITLPANRDVNVGFRVVCHVRGTP
ncbi:MAG: formylglycine-generating enzyme family protein [Leptolyngbya sp. DLM2.Bin15]|nr:MAG: formylglycine-generating enzyme family protein [Leptolyngbya sp. DLM2.Bin15]